jgi:hypothetical protein
MGCNTVLFGEYFLNFVGITLLNILGQTVEEDSLTIKMMALQSCRRSEPLITNCHIHETQISSNIACANLILHD